jgi:hypothetical protein
MIDAAKEVNCVLYWWAMFWELVPLGQGGRVLQGCWKLPVIHHTHER